MNSKYKNLTRWNEAEFRDFAEEMGDEQLAMLEAFAIAWGKAVHVSTHPAALGRYLGPDALSGHNVERWEEVVATDIFPEGLRSEDFAQALTIALQSGATGIGFYADTFWNGQAAPMMHLDTRPDRTPENPRIWVRIKGAYRDIQDVMPVGWVRAVAVARANVAPVVAPAIVAPVKAKAKAKTKTTTAKKG
tara:strand:+ start:20954 stop:21526 length:573 start_codon:yes stop_codon:yes gene_type:complete